MPKAVIRKIEGQSFSRT